MKPMNMFLPDLAVEDCLDGIEIVLLGEEEPVAALPAPAEGAATPGNRA